MHTYIHARHPFCYIEKTPYFMFTASSSRQIADVPFRSCRAFPGTIVILGGRDHPDVSFKQLDGFIDSIFKNQEIDLESTLPETNSSHLKMGWLENHLPFGARLIFRCELLVSGSVSYMLLQSRLRLPPKFWLSYRKMETHLNGGPIHWCFFFPWIFSQLTSHS